MRKSCPQLGPLKAGFCRRIILPATVQTVQLLVEQTQCRPPSEKRGEQLDEETRVYREKDTHPTLRVSQTSLASYQTSRSFFLLGIKDHQFRSRRGSLDFFLG